IGRIDGKLVINPTTEQLENSDFDLVVAGTKHFVNMIEVGGRETGEDEMADAIKFGHDVVVECCGMIEELMRKANAPEKVGNITAPEAGFVDSIRARVADKIRDAKGKPGKHDRSDAVKKIQEDLL